MSGSDDLLIASVEEEASKPTRRAQLEWSIGAERLAALEQQETLIGAGSQASAPAFKRARAKRKLLTEIGTHAPAGPGAVAQLREAFARFVACPIEGCEPATDGDMLLIEWGTYHDVFRLSFVRQMTPTGPNDEHIGM